MQLIRNRHIFHLTAIIATAALLFSGCGGGGGGDNEAENQPQQPAELIDQLVDASARATIAMNDEARQKQIDRLLNMLTPAALGQTAAEWQVFLNRTGNQPGLVSIGQIKESPQTLARMKTADFFAKLAENPEAAAAFSRFFSMRYVTHVEQDNQILAIFIPRSGKDAYMAFARDENGKLLLMSEKETGEVRAKLARQLRSHMIQQQKDAAAARAAAAAEDEALRSQNAAADGS